LFLLLRKAESAAKDYEKLEGKALKLVGMDGVPQ
jgi:hypothetical protein